MITIIILCVVAIVVVGDVVVAAADDVVITVLFLEIDRRVVVAECCRGVFVAVVICFDFLGWWGVLFIQSIHVSIVSVELHVLSFQILLARKVSEASLLH